MFRSPDYYVLNTTVVPCEGLWDVQKCTLEYARDLTGRKDHKGQPCFTSAVGHESTATLISTLLETAVPVNRIAVAPKVGDVLLCFKLKQRAPEGKILSVQELENLGYEFFLMELVAASRGRFYDQAQEDQRLRERLKVQTEGREFLGGHRD